MPTSDGAAAPVLHDERLHAPVSWWLLTGLFAVTVAWSFLLATPPWFAALTGLVALGIVGGGLWSYGSVRVAVVDGGEVGPVLVAGRARLPLGHAGHPQHLDRTQTRQRMAAGADARAFLMMRPYVHRAVLVPVEDIRDPTPYWLVGTRSPEHLAATLRTARAHLTD